MNINTKNPRNLVSRCRKFCRVKEFRYVSWNLYQYTWMFISHLKTVYRLHHYCRYTGSSQLNYTVLSLFHLFHSTKPGKWLLFKISGLAVIKCMKKILRL